MGEPLARPAAKPRAFADPAAQERRWGAALISARVRLVFMPAGVRPGAHDDSTSARRLASPPPSAILPARAASHPHHPRGAVTNRTARLLLLVIVLAYAGLGALYALRTPPGRRPTSRPTTTMSATSPRRAACPSWRRATIPPPTSRRSRRAASRRTCPSPRSAMRRTSRPSITCWPPASTAWPPGRRADPAGPAPLLRPPGGAGAAGRVPRPAFALPRGPVDPARGAGPGRGPPAARGHDRGRQ